MSGFGVELLNKFVPEALSRSASEGTAGYRPLAARSGAQLQQLQQLHGLAATRVYQGQDIPANVGGLASVRVSPADPFALAAMQAAY
jgi:hypothetical protein